MGDVTQIRGHLARWSTLVLVLLALGGGSRSYCPMPMPDSRVGSEGRVAHACGKTGMAPAAPACCHAKPPANTEATIQADINPFAAVTSAFVTLHPDEVALARHLTSAPGSAVPPPSPPLVLRI